MRPRKVTGTRLLLVMNVLFQHDEIRRRASGNLATPDMEAFQAFQHSVESFFFGTIRTRCGGTHTRVCSKKNPGVLKADCCTAQSFSSYAAQSRLLVQGLTSHVLYCKMRQGSEQKTPRIILTVEHRTKSYFKISLFIIKIYHVFLHFPALDLIRIFCWSIWRDSKHLLLVSFCACKREVALAAPRRELGLYSSVASE